MVKIFCVIFGVWVKFEGQENLPKNDKDCPEISIFAPHTTLMDFVALLPGKVRPISCIANYQETKRKFVSFAYNIIECIPVDHYDPVSRKSCIQSIKHRGNSPYWKGRQLLLQAEGVTHGGRGICQIKQGGFIPGVPVQVTVLEWVEWQDVLRGNFSKERRQARGSGWFSWAYDDPFWFPYFYAFCCPLKYVIIKSLPIYHPNDDEIHDAELYASNVKNYICKLGNIPDAECNRFDGELLTYMHKKYPELKPDDYILKCEELEQEFGTKVLTKENLFKAFDDAVGAGLRGDAWRKFIAERLSEIHEEHGYTSSSSYGRI